MAKKKQIVTNAMRHLQASKIDFEAIEYECDGEIGEDFGMKISEKQEYLPNSPLKPLWQEVQKTELW